MLRSMKLQVLRLTLCGAVAVASLAIVSGASAQGVAVTPNATPPKSVAVLAAVGDQFQYVRRKVGIGSNLDPYIRRWATMGGNGLNMIVLRGMDRALASQFPGSELTLLTLTPTAEDRAVLPQACEAHTMKRVLDYLRPLPEREKWEQIFVVTPRWLMDERKGMGSKLSGIGLFVQPIASNVREEFDDIAVMDAEVRDLGKEKQPRSDTYVAPFFYIQVTVLDGKTLAVLRREERYDFRKIINSDSATLDVEKSFTAAQLGSEIERFVETAARRMVVDREGTVDVGTVRTLPPQAQPDVKK